MVHLGMFFLSTNLRNFNRNFYLYQVSRYEGGKEEETRQVQTSSFPPLVVPVWPLCHRNWGVALLLCFMKLSSFLLRDHVKAMEERKLLHSFLAKSQEELPPRRMKDSYVEVLLPLGSQPELREKYLTVQNAIR